jgi:hypothetical protein
LYVDYRKLLIKKGIEIPPGFEVHHIDGNHSNNTLANLAVVSKKDHRRLHTGYVYNNGVLVKQCKKCGCWKPAEYFMRFLKPSNICNDCKIKPHANIELTKIGVFGNFEKPKNKPL